MQHADGWSLCSRALGSDDYSVKDWNLPAMYYPYKEERLAHHEVTEEWQLTWRALPSLVYRGPTPELDWVQQWAVASNKFNRTLLGTEIVPVLQLLSCGRCVGSRSRLV